MDQMQIDNYLKFARETCQQGIIDQPKLRDAAIVFYITICSFFIGLASKTDWLQFTYWTVLVTLIGIACFLRIVGHRVWNIQYLRAVQIINELLLSEEPFNDKKQLLSHIESLKPKYHYNFKSLFTSIGNVTAISFSLLVTVPFIYWLSTCYIDVLPNHGIVILSLAYALLFSVLSSLYLYRCINSENNKYMWLFATVTFSNNDNKHQ